MKLRSLRPLHLDDTHCFLVVRITTYPPVYLLAIACCHRQYAFIILIAYSFEADGDGPMLLSAHLNVDFFLK